MSEVGSIELCSFDLESTLQIIIAVLEHLLAIVGRIEANQGWMEVKMNATQKKNEKKGSQPMKAGSQD